jgi:pyrroline-5-carboxylate reductase
MKIGFIGCGEITRAIVTGLDRARYDYGEIIVSTRSAEISAGLRRDCARVRVSDDNQRIADEADMLVLAVRPQVAAEVLSRLRYRKEQLVVSLIATLTHERLRLWTGPDVTIVRATPLPFVATCDGPTPIFPAHDAVTALFDALGRTIVTTTREEFDAIGVASATMGLYFGLQETLTGWLAEKGISAEAARAYVGAIFLNLAKTGSVEIDTSLEELRHAHSTRGGLNEQMYRVFCEHEGLRALRAGLDSVYARERRATPSEMPD